MSVLRGVPVVESPLYEQAVEELGLSPGERRIADDLHHRGYAVIDFPDTDILDRVERIKRRFAPRFGLDPDQPSRRISPSSVARVQDAWHEDEDVRAIAANPQILALLGKIYGRRAIPFQTLNFPVGTEQHLHSDSNHFSSLPERFMCGVWLALEDVHPDAGPLTYAPGSHKWPIITNLMIGRRGEGGKTGSAQAPFEQVWQEMLEAQQLGQEVLLAKRGQALIWAANLLHGGSYQQDKSRTRWSQVTHYYFENCIYYTPAYSDEAVGQLALRSITDVATGEKVPNLYLGQPIEETREPSEQDTEQPARRSWWQSRKRLTRSENAQVPADFDAATYLSLNPDVAASGVDPRLHYVRHGQREGRFYRID